MASNYPHGIEVNNKVLLTPEGGVAIRLTNKTGSTSIKGLIVSASSEHDNAFALQANQYDSMGVVYEGGIADGQLCWVVINGIAELMMEDGTEAVRGNWVFCSTTDGRANASLSEPGGGGFVNASEHFKEIGHCLESKAAGTNVIAKCIIHFN